MKHGNTFSKIGFFFNKWLFLSLSIRKKRSIFVMQSETIDLNIALMYKSKADRPASHKAAYLTKWAVLVLTMALTTVGKTQGWELSYGGNREDFGQSVIQTQDLGFVIVGYSESYGFDNDLDVLVIRTDVDGHTLWIKEFDEGYVEHAYDVLETEDEGYLIIGDYTPVFGSMAQVYLLKISKYGDFEWSRKYSNLYDNLPVQEQGYALIKASSGTGYAMIGRTKGSASGEDDILLIRVDNEGNELWRQTYGGDGDDRGTAIAALPDDGFIIAGNVRTGPVLDGTDRMLMRIDANGSEVWNIVEGNSQEYEELHDVIVTQDGGIISVGTAKNSTRAYIGRHTLDGDFVWEKVFNPGQEGGSINAVRELPDGKLIVTGYVEVTAANSDVYVAKFDATNGNELWARNIGSPDNLDSGEGITITSDGGFAIGGTNALSGVLITDVSLIKTDALGNIITNHITGKVYHSLDGCNDFGTGDVPLTNWIIKAEGSNNTYFGTTDANGDFDILTDTGTYVVTVLRPNDYWDVCDPAGLTATFTDFYGNANFNFPVQTATVCPYLDVRVKTDFLAVCEDVTYTVEYTNIGPAAAENAFVNVTLDSALTYVSSSIPFSVVNGTVYTFPLGDIPSLEKESFTINTQMACTGIAMGQAALVSAHIFPDTFCLQPNPNWDGSSVTVNGVCLGDSIRFSLRNIGLGEMATSLKYFVVEDQVMFLQDTFRLNSGEEEFITFEGNGATYRLISEQSEGHPGNDHPTIAIEGCVPEGEPYSTGFVTQFPENEQDPFVAVDVQEAGGSNTLPISMRGYPKGYQDSLITVNTDLTYTILFSNVGTDTVNRVVIRDTLSPNLDVTTLTPGASSHPYDFEIYSNGVLKITFNEIQLQPGDSVAEAQNRGFVEFRIAQKPDNSLGTVINNSAVVYFDYHAPVQTNTVRHIVGCNNLFDPEEGCIVVVDVKTPPVSAGQIKVFPNPFAESATFEISGQMYPSVTLRLFDLQGRLVRNEEFQGNRFDFFRRNLASGMYLFRVEAQGQLISSGKMIIR